MNRARRLMVAALLIALAASPARSAPPDDPFRPAENKGASPQPGKGAGPDDPFAPGAAGGGAWGGGSTIPIDSRTAVTFGPPGCPVAVVGSGVWDLKVNKSVATLVGAYEARALRAVSAEGGYFAAGSKSPNQTDTAVTVWNTKTGQRALEVPGDKKSYVDFLALTRERYLLLGGRHSDQVDVWDLESGKVVKRLTVPDRRVDTGKIAFSPDGKYFACVAHDKIVVTETATNKAVVTLDPPGPGAPADAAAKGPPGKRNPSLDAIFVYSWLGGLAFSPDGTELAAFSTHPGPRLLVWNVKGKLVLDEPVPMPRVVGHRSTLEWQPGGTGWLVNGYLYDRAAKRIVLSVRVPFAAEQMPHLLDKDRLIGTFGGDTSRLQVLAVPADKLSAAVKAMSGKDQSYLAPGKPVGLELQLTGLRGDDADTRKVLTDALTHRLSRDGIPVGDTKGTVLRLKLSEEAGDTLPIFERQSPFDFRGKYTGRAATEAKGAAVLELVARGETKPLWRGHLSAMSARSFKEEITDAAVRKSMLEHLTRQLGGMDMPYFIPKSKDVLALPAIVE